jgi:hypothetical protein
MGYNVDLVVARRFKRQGTAGRKDVSFGVPGRERRK